MHKPWWRNINILQYYKCQYSYTNFTDTFNLSVLQSKLQDQHLNQEFQKEDFFLSAGCVVPSWRYGPYTNFWLHCKSWEILKVTCYPIKAWNGLMAWTLRGNSLERSDAACHIKSWLRREHKLANRSKRKTVYKTKHWHERYFDNIMIDFNAII